MTDFLRVWKLPELSDRLTMLVSCVAEKIAVFSTENEKNEIQSASSRWASASDAVRIVAETCLRPDAVVTASY